MFLQVSPSSEHQDFFTFMQRVLSPVLEAYSGAAIFVHSLLSPMTEREYTHRLFKYLLMRTEKGVAAYGQSLAACTICLVICLTLVLSLMSFFPFGRRERYALPREKYNQNV